MNINSHSRTGSNLEVNAITIYIVNIVIATTEPLNLTAAKHNDEIATKCDCMKPRLVQISMVCKFETLTTKPYCCNRYDDETLMLQTDNTTFILDFFNNCKMVTKHK